MTETDLIRSLIGYSSGDTSASSGRGVSKRLADRLAFMRPSSRMPDAGLVLYERYERFLALPVGGINSDCIMHAARDARNITINGWRAPQRSESRRKGGGDNA
jgi:hypothetical protein